jgi:transcription antitermination factor NusG
MTTTTAHPWFAIQTRVRHEQAVTRQLEGKGYECFLPMYRARRKWSDRTKELAVPLFEGYVFSRLDDRLGRVVTTPGVIRLVNLAGRPVPIEEDEMTALQRIAAVARTVEPVPYLRVGQRVRIASGGLEGIEGVLLEFRGGRRMVVSIELLRRSVAVELHQDLLTAIDDRAEANRPFGAGVGMR